MAAPGPRPPALAALAAHIASSATATEALQSWCTAYLSGPPTPVLAKVRHDRPVALATYAGSLTLHPGETLRHRLVSLQWNGITLSHAENWYLPDRLPPHIGAALLATSTPFGALIQPLAPIRRPVSTTYGTTLHLRAIVAIHHAGDVADVDEHYAPILTDGLVAAGT